MNSDKSKFLTSPAIFTGKSVISKEVIVDIPDLPAIKLVQNASKPIPKGETTPSPVIATLLFINAPLCN